MAFGTKDLKAAEDADYLTGCLSQVGDDVHRLRRKLLGCSGDLVARLSSGLFGAACGLVWGPIGDNLVDFLTQLIIPVRPP